MPIGSDGEVVDVACADTLQLSGDVFQMGLIAEPRIVFDVSWLKTCCLDVRSALRTAARSAS